MSHGCAQHLGRVRLLLWILRCVTLLRIALLGRVAPGVAYICRDDISGHVI